MDKKIPIYWFVISGLIVVAIITATCWLAKKDDAVAYISFAATITSLVLGVIAIFYSMVTNNQSSENIGAIQKASDDVSQGASKISDISNDVKNSVGSLTLITNELQKQLQTVPGLFEDVKVTLGKTESNIIEVVKKQTLIKNELQSDINPHQNKNVLSEEIVTEFLQNSSFSGLIILYAVLLSLKNEIPFDVDTFTKKIQPSPELYLGYYNGYLIASASFGLFVFKYNQTKIEIVSMDSTCMKQIPDRVHKLADYNDALNAKNTDQAQFKWIETVKAVESFFEKK